MFSITNIESIKKLNKIIIANFDFKLKKYNKIFFFLENESKIHNIIFF